MPGKTEVELLIFIKRNGLQLLGPGTIALLRQLQISDSLRRAAKELHMSYQHAWTVIDEMNKAAPSPVVVKQRGGTGGGGALLTDFGRRMLVEYKIIETEVHRFVNRINTEMNL